MKKKNLILNITSGSAKCVVAPAPARPVTVTRRASLPYDSQITLAKDSTGELSAQSIVVVSFSKDATGLLKAKTFHPQMRKTKKASTLAMDRVVANNSIFVEASRDGKGGAKHSIYCASIL